MFFLMPFLFRVRSSSLLAKQGQAIQFEGTRRSIALKADAGAQMFLTAAQYIQERFIKLCLRVPLLPLEAGPGSAWTACPAMTLDLQPGSTP